ncbi:MAG: ATP-binding cassette domain-containing protein [Bacillota bacterium]
MGNARPFDFGFSPFVHTGRYELGVVPLAVFQSEDLTYRYPETEHPALRDINLVVDEGEFLLIAGESASGKSTLARALAGLIPHFYGGRLDGSLTYRGTEISSMKRGQLAREVGIVFQDPEKQLVATGVEAELAFGPENLGLPPEEIGRRLAEVMTFLNLTAVKNADTACLSGGQKQRVALAAVLAMQPKVLILDEPTSQLDPVAAEELLGFLKRLNEDTGLTVILVEQRLERCFHLVNRVVYLEKGTIAFDGSPGETARRLAEKGLPCIPPVARFWAMAGFSPVPVTVKEGRDMLRRILPDRQNGERSRTPHPPTAGADTDNSRRKAPEKTPEVEPQELYVSLEKVWFTYPDGTEALKDIKLNVAPGEFLAVLGPNGAGKSTLLRVMAGLLKPGRGRIAGPWDNNATKTGPKAMNTAYLSQNPNDYLLRDTVEDELLFTLRNFRLPDDGVVDRVLAELRLEPHRRAHPRDLSGGERQRVALASMLVAGPRLLLLDEPTRGMDYRLKSDLGQMLRRRAAAGAGVALVTHDVEFVAQYAARVALLFDGRIVRSGPISTVLSDSLFYSTQISKLSKGFAQGLLTPEDALKEWGPYLNKGP